MTRAFLYYETKPIDAGSVAVIELRISDTDVNRVIDGMHLDAINGEDTEGAEHLRQMAAWVKKRARVGGWIVRATNDRRTRRLFCLSAEGPR